MVLHDWAGVMFKIAGLWVAALYSPDSYNVLGQRLTMTNELFIGLLLFAFVAVDFLARSMRGDE